MIIILRLLVGLLIYKIVDWCGVFIATLMCEEGASMEKVLARTVKNRSYLLALFITLWIIAMGWL